MFRLLLICALATATVAASGCTDPYSNRATPRATATAASRAPAAGASPPAHTAQEAIRRFAITYINWRARGLAAQKARLADSAAASLRADLLKQSTELAAAAAADDGAPFTGRSNTGTVEVVSANTSGQVYVLTHETATLDETREQTAYLVYRAAAWHVSGSFKLTQFEAVN
jgi:hypothetical protein